MSIRGRLEVVVSGVIILGFVLVVAFSAFYFFTHTRSIERDTKEAAQFEQYKRSAFDIKRKLYDFEYVCDEVHVPPGVMCRSEREEFIIWTAVEGGYYCTDSGGFVGIVTEAPVKTGFRCQ